MSYKSYNLLLVLLIGLLCACGPDTLSDESGENDDESPSFDNDLQASTLETCQVKELIIGTWKYYDEITNGELTFNGGTVTFTPDGGYDEYARESTTEILAHAKGVYSVISSNELKIDYTLIFSYDGEILAEENFSENVSVGFSWNELQLQFTDSPVFHLLRQDDNANHDFTSAKAYKRDGICDTAYLTDCPAQTLIGEWVLAPHYEKDRLDWPMQISRYYWIDTRESMTFYSDGAFTVTQDGQAFEDNTYRVLSCEDTACSDNDWYLGMHFSTLTGQWGSWSLVSEDVATINISDDTLSFQLLDDPPLPVLIYTKISNTETEGEAVKCYTD